MTDLFSPISRLPHVSAKREATYKKLGIYTPYDLLCHYPRSYIDLTNPRPIRSYRLGTKGVVIGRVINKSESISGRYTIYKNIIQEEITNELFRVTIFNSRYAHDKLSVGGMYILYGKIDSSYSNDMLEINSPIVVNAYNRFKIQPVYHLTAGLSNAMVMADMHDSLNMLCSQPFDNLTQSILDENALVSLPTALRYVHLPNSMDNVITGRRRLAFDELLLLQLGMESMKRISRHNTGCTMHQVSADEYINSLPFQLTDGQLSAIKDIQQDLMGDAPMNRLVQGDVGSGKTVVAMFGCYYSARNGFQSAMMAPTEILAQQHYETFNRVLTPLGIKVGLLTGSLTTKEKREVRKLLLNGSIDVIVGTHAIIQKDTQFHNLGLVITDEQHRFGVAQRAKLADKGNYPHRLVMSATPIPRTLGLIIYGDLEISTIKQLPAGRQPVETFAVSGKLRSRAYNYIIKHLESGGQAYIVCPTIDENDSMESVYEYYNSVSSGVLRGYKVGILHGRMSSEEKDRIMLNFKNGLLDVLISTTVIEVGVDVPNASIILIENAEHFGLSQLHQLRGRVGRGTRKSSCILVTDNVNDTTKSRLKVMCSTTDGFEIAEKDLELRGCGDFFGQRQHGLPTLRVADLVNDFELIQRARDTAHKILDQDPELSSDSYAGLKLAVIKMFDSAVD